MQKSRIHDTSTIVAISTPPGSGGIAIVRLSGPDAIRIADSAWRGKSLEGASSHTSHLGFITSSDGGEDIDNAVATIFRGPGSFTGEDTVEFSVHGSPWIQRKTVERLTESGAVPAAPGEFTMRAFMNGRIDLAQAEGVADLIASSSRAAHKLAMSQMSGSFSAKINELRDRLVEFAALLELELDFSEEDVEFADRSHLADAADDAINMIDRLVASYRAGKAFKEGFPVTIAGAPNAGKSTLLNLLLGEDKAIVSDIPGTTRDIIEDTKEIDGILFRFRDTAGLRQTDDSVERIGIDRTKDAIARAAVVIWIADVSRSDEDLVNDLRDLKVQQKVHPGVKFLLALNKIDKVSNWGERSKEIIGMIGAQWGIAGDDIKVESGKRLAGGQDEWEENDVDWIIGVSATEGRGLKDIERRISAIVKERHNPENELIISNVRHMEALKSARGPLFRAKEAIEEGISADLIAQEVREAVHHLGEITGSITADTLLSTIFSRFCIGK